MRYAPSYPTGITGTTGITANFITAARPWLAALAVVSAALPIALPIVLPTAAHAQEYISASRTVAGGNPFTETIENNVIIGTTSTGVDAPGVTLDVVSSGKLNATDTYYTRMYSNSVMNVLGGTVGRVSLFGNNALRVSSGSVAGISTSFLSGITNVQISGGLVAQGSGSGVGSSLNNTTIISGGAVGGTTAIAGGSVFVTGGSVQRVTALSGNFTQTGGATQNIEINRRNASTSITSNVTISGGTLGLGAPKGAISTNTLVNHETPVNITILGGAISEGIFSRGTSTKDSFQFRGGTYSNFTKPLGVANPQFASFYILGSTNFDFYGTNLALSNETAGSFYSTFDEELGFGNILYSGSFFTITGTLENGQTINNRIFKASSGGGQIRLNPVGGSAAPEPGSLALLGMGTLPLVGMVARRRRK